MHLDQQMTVTASRPLYSTLGIFLVLAGLLGHLLAANAIGGTHLAYRDHIAGFFLIAIVTGLIIGALGRRFWRTRVDVTVLIFGAVQALTGALVYVNRFALHG